LVVLRFVAESLRDQEVGGSNPLAPTVVQKKPFGENVEGLFHYRDGSCSFKIVFK
jgi:hypothetical protein